MNTTAPRRGRLARLFGFARPAAAPTKTSSVSSARATQAAPELPPAPVARRPIMPAVNRFDDPAGFQLDIEYDVPYPDALVARYPQALVAGGSFSSRMEQERKIDVPRMSIDLGEVSDAMIAKLYERLTKITADPSLLGEGWSVKMVDKYYARDDAGAVKTDPDTKLPIVNPMIDLVWDRKADLPLLSSSRVLRFRELEGDWAHQINIKPGFGITDDVATTRLEYSLMVRPEVRDDLSLLDDFFTSNEHLNPFRYLAGAVPGLKPSELEPALLLVDFRYKFQLAHESGTEIEISLDDLRSSPYDADHDALVGHLSNLDEDALPNVPRVRLGQIEMELAHKELPKENLSTQFDPSDFVFDAAPEPEGPPRIHTPKDLENAEIRRDATYRQFGEVNERLVEVLFEGLPAPKAGGQKGHEVAKRLAAPTPTVRPRSGPFAAPTGAPRPGLKSAAPSLVSVRASSPKPKLGGVVDAWKARAPSPSKLEDVRESVQTRRDPFQRRFEANDWKGEIPVIIGDDFTIVADYGSIGERGKLLVIPSGVMPEDAEINFPVDLSPEKQGELDRWVAATQQAFIDLGWKDEPVRAHVNPPNALTVKRLHVHVPGGKPDGERLTKEDWSALRTAIEKNLN